MSLTEEQLSAIGEFAEWANKDHREGRTMLKLFEELETHKADDRKEFRRIRRALEVRGFRDPMPTIDPDDSGSINVAFLGTRAAFRGKWPVRTVLGILVLVVFGATGAVIDRAFSAGAAHAEAPHVKVGE